MEEVEKTEEFEEEEKKLGQSKYLATPADSPPGGRPPYLTPSLPRSVLSLIALLV